MHHSTLSDREPQTGFLLLKPASTTALLRIAAAVAMLIVAVQPLRAQQPDFPDSIEAQSMVARTERFSATHNASLSLDYRLRQPLLTGVVRSYLLSSTTLLGSPSTRDQIDLLADMQYELPSPVNLFVRFEGTMTNDIGGGELISGLNNTATTFVGIGGRAQSDNGNYIGVAAGGAYNRQLNTEDAGGALFGEFAGMFEAGEYLLRTTGNGRWHNTTPRTNSNLYVDLTVDRDFGEGTYFAATGDYRQAQNDLYIKRREEDILQYGGLTYDGVQKRSEEQYRLGLTFIYPAGGYVAFDGDLAVSGEGLARWESEEGLPPLPREPDPYRLDQRDFAISGSLGTSYEPGRLRLASRISYRANEQRNLIDPTIPVPEPELRRRRQTSASNDFLSSHLLLSGEAVWRPGRRDTVGLSGSVGIYRYDTPDTTNNFDKDEQSIQGQIRYARRFSPLLHFEVYGQAFLNHLVYLFGENSNDNNWNRIFRLAPTVGYVLPDVMSNYMAAELVANYTEYDFEGRTQNIRGRSFRELVIRDSLTLYLSGRLGLTTSGTMRISERGSFSWSRFAESLLERTRTEGLEAELFSGRDSAFHYGVGGRLSRVKNYRADPRGELFPFSDRTSVGPTARLNLPVSESTRLEMSGWWEHRFEDSELTGKTPWLFLTLNLKL